MKQEFGEGPGDMQRCIRDLQNMLAASPYLPDPGNFDTKFLELFVVGCRMDMERARSKLENFCLARVRHRDLYEYRSLTEPPLNDLCNFIDIVSLPKLTDEGFRVTIFRIKAGYPESSADISMSVRAVLLICEARMRDEHRIAGDVFIYETSHVRSSLAARVATAVSAVRRGTQLAQVAYPQRLKRIHVVGAPPFIMASLQLMRSFVNEKVRKRYLIHPKIEDLLEYIPARVLPAEWGGEEVSIDVLAKKWRTRIDESREFLRNLNEVCQRTPEKISDVDIYGTVGAFRKLDID